MLIRVGGELIPPGTVLPVERGTIQLSRVQGGYRDRLRRYSVLIDGRQAGRVGRGRTLRFDVPAGAHTLQLKVDWCLSARLTVEAEPGKIVYFTCAPNGDAVEALASVTVKSSDYIALWQTSEPAVLAGLAKTPTGWGMRFLLGTGFGFVGGALTLAGAWIWRYAAGASAADSMVASVSLAVCAASMAVFKLGRGRMTRHRSRT